ncbi:MAG TPA: DUF885 domain-containing protein [Lacipirellulaceae bacterium]|nr:DUF885 domain-containing protein [Lacipirellulaceae bacterium]
MRSYLRLGVCVIAVAVAAMSGTPLPAAESAAGDEFAALLEEAWEFRLREDPLFATETGDHRFDDQLPKISLADENRRDAARRSFMSRLEDIPRDALTAANQVNYDVFGISLRNGIRDHEFKLHLMPVTDRYGFHIEFPELPRNLSLSTVRDYENYIARLGRFAEYAAGHVELMREGVRQGMTAPSVIMQRYNEPIEAQIVDDLEKSLLYAPLREFPTGVPEAEHERLRAAARKAIAESVVPGYREFLKFMKEDYVPNCRGTIAASALPQGRDFYRYCVEKFTTLDDLTPQQVHEIGLAEVGRIRGEMDEIIRRVEFEGDFAAFTEFLRNEPKFYAKTPEELEKEVAFAMKRMEGELPKLFGRLPRMPCGVRQVPAYIAPQATFAYYQTPSGDGSRAGFFYINTFNLPSRPLYMIEALSLHESIPGHHLQLAIQQELDDLPPFRKYTGFTAYVEGWALYSERLGLEAGFYTDPYSDFGRLTMEIWRACRLVVDTGMHYLGWTREQAIDFMRANSAMPMHDIRAEVDRYIGWPGQALGYKIGELKIRELRKEAEQRLGERFDVRAFHDTVLGSGSVPLGVLEKNVAKWVDTRLAAERDDSTNAPRTTTSD